jgi:hypothetical protein
VSTWGIRRSTLTPVVEALGAVTGSGVIMRYIRMSNTRICTSLPY